MNEDEAREFSSMIRSSWAGSYFDESMEAHWTEFFRQYSIDDVARAFTILQRKSEKIPTQAAFADIIEGEAAHRVKCPHCGIGFKTEARMQEHVDNVHW